MFIEDFFVTPGSDVEYDKQKEISNQSKHGHSLEDPVSLLTNMLLFNEKQPLVEIGRRLVDNEKRWTILGFNELKKYLVFVVTKRNTNTIRIISCRRASKKERIQYAQICKDFVGSFSRQNLYFTTSSSFTTSEGQ